VRVLAIPGSLRAESLNARLLRYAAEHAPARVELELYGQARLKAIPPYDEDDDTDPAPPPVVDLRAVIDGADAILIATPEYNASIPGVLKNAIDWASRPRATSVLRNKPAAVIGASTSRFGAVWAQEEARKVLATAGARVIDTKHAVARAHQHFDEHGRLASTDHQAGVLRALDALLAEADRDCELVPA
jgi:chromate reductase